MRFQLTKENEAMWSFLYIVWGVSFKSSKETLIKTISQGTIFAVAIYPHEILSSNY